MLVLLMLNCLWKILIRCAYHCPNEPTGNDQLHADDDKRRYPSEQMTAKQHVQREVRQSEKTPA